MKKRWIAFWTLVVIFIALHFALEPVALHYVNKALGNIDGYDGHVDDVDIALYRGAYAIDTLTLEKVDGDLREPFVKIDRIDLSVQWKALFKGAIVGEIIMVKPIINFQVSPATGEVEAGDGGDWTEAITSLLPIEINRFEIRNGQVHYIDDTQSPAVDVMAYNINALATNLNNADDNEELLPSHISLSSGISEQGSIAAEMDINILKQTPDFDLSLELKDLNLTYLKDFTDAYANFTFKEGMLYASSEIAMKDGAFDGYVKPVISDAKIIDLKNKDTNFWRKAWEVIVGTTLKVFSNQPKDQFATEVSFSGDINNTEIGIWGTLGNVLENAFLNAFHKNIDDDVSIENVDGKDKKGFFEELFDKDE